MARTSLMNPWFGVLAAQLAVGRSAIETVSSMIGGASRADPQRPQTRTSWASPHRTLCELATVRVLDFTPPRLDVPRPATCALVVAPYALHRASVADFAPGHSVVEALLGSSAARLYLTDWRSARAERRFDSIDTYLADINVIVDDLGSGAPVALVGLCQGGWLAAAFAARFPRKVYALVLAGAPIDIVAERSALGVISAATPREAVDELAMWPLAEPTPTGVREILQIDNNADGDATEALVRRFMKWHRTVVDLPSVFYRQTVDWIFRENRLASGRFRALGETVNLKKVTCPLFLLAAENDEITSPGQLIATAKLVGTPQQRIETHMTPGRHLSLFMGRATLAKAWPLAARFLAQACEARVDVAAPAALRLRPPRTAAGQLKTQRSTPAA
jgi:poly(3-hydroxyalkanoate) synthetase